VSWRRITRRDDPEGYVRRIVVNQFLNRARSLRREWLVAAPPDDVGREQDRVDDEVRGALADLPRQQRAVLVLRYYLDLSEVQIAETLGCSVGTVKSNASRGMAKLRAALAPPDQVGR
jgi:RNA polymerase sigma factor (sigma-70 family)